MAETIDNPQADSEENQDKVASYVPPARTKSAGMTSSTASGAAVDVPAPRMSLAERLNRRNAANALVAHTDDNAHESDDRPDHLDIAPFAGKQSSKPPRPVAKPRQGFVLGESTTSKIPWVALPALEEEVREERTPSHTLPAETPSPLDAAPAQTAQAGFPSYYDADLLPVGSSYGLAAWGALDKVDRTVAEIHTQAGSCLVALDWDTPGHEIIRSLRLSRMLLIEEGAMYDYLARLSEQGIQVGKGELKYGAVGWVRLIGTDDTNILTPNFTVIPGAPVVSTRGSNDGSDLRPIGQLPGGEFVIIVPSKNINMVKRIRPVLDSVARHGMPLMAVIFRPFDDKPKVDIDNAADTSHKRAMRVLKSDSRHCDLTKLADSNAGVVGIATYPEAIWTNSEANTLDERLNWLKQSGCEGIEHLPEEEIEEVAISALQAERAGTLVTKEWLLNALVTAIAIYSPETSSSPIRQRDHSCA